VCRWRQASILVVFILMAGCASQPGQDGVQRNWPDHSAQLLSLDHWHAEGKISLRNTERAESASIAWIQDKNITQLSLSGPMGLSATTIYSDGSILEVTRDGASRRYDISSPEVIIRETGWDLPLQALPHWLKGVPSPDLDIQTLEVEQGLLKHLIQSGWTISYKAYGQFGSFALPTKLHIERAGTRARLIIRNWTIEAT
jgi:outer membrane lipoprotein LolB